MLKELYDIVIIQRVSTFHVYICEIIRKLNPTLIGWPFTWISKKDLINMVIFLIFFPSYVTAYWRLIYARHVNWWDPHNMLKLIYCSKSWAVYKEINLVYVLSNINLSRNIFIICGCHVSWYHLVSQHNHEIRLSMFPLCMILKWLFLVDYTGLINSLTNL